MLFINFNIQSKARNMSDLFFNTLVRLGLPPSLITTEVPLSWAPNCLPGVPVGAVPCS